ncbi:hypothetical protein I3842_09G215400 [Carya illinoinensis]|uniref:RNase H type-1 domain-containing protein n=1 Tax=Carya illinoinensis TaxID=32201 RepID=A0A922E6H4_CARIL|nr:hypothetical protein I3842_09G215400 [Carya illinoinensis]
MGNCANAKLKGSSFFHAGLGRCSSYTWRGIWEACKWLVTGCTWRIGSGTAVNLWSDQWIPGHKSLLAEGVMVRDDMRRAVVNSLFLPNAGAWDIPKLRALFNPMSVWSLERNGMFSVKSCYRVIQDSLGSHFPEASSRSRPLLWKHLWKMKLCLSAPATITHALVFCPSVHVFFSTHFPGFCFHPTCSVVDLAMDIIASHKPEDLSVFFSLAWSFWFRRNKFVHEQIVIPPRQSTDHALVMVCRFSQIHTPLRDLWLHYKWKAPSPGWLKLNVDGVAFSDLGRSGVGVVLRDHTGKVLMAVSQTELEMGGSEPLELMVIFRGIQMCATMGIPKLMVESDSLLCIEGLWYNNMHQSMLGGLYSEIQSLVARYVCCEFSHVYREGNQVAHGLARTASSIVYIAVWWDCIPDYISQAV